MKENVCAKYVLKCFDGAIQLILYLFAQSNMKRNEFHSNIVTAADATTIDATASEYYFI